MTRIAALALAAGIVAAVAGTAAAEPFGDLTGTAFSGSSDLHVRQPAAGNDFVFHGVSFHEGDYGASPWWGVRGGYFFE